MAIIQALIEIQKKKKGERDRRETRGRKNRKNETKITIPQKTSPKQGERRENDTQSTT